MNLSESTALAWLSFKTGTGRGLVMAEDKERYCRDELRTARAAVLRDAEAITQMLFALERVGAIITGRLGTLGSYQPRLAEVGKRSALAKEVPEKYPALHVGFGSLYRLVLDARNDAMHQGAYARHLAQHAIELSLILEDAFMNGSNCISDYMVKSPLCAELWQPVSLIRQQMLSNSFSFLPVFLDSHTWKVVSDCGLAKWLRTQSNDGERRKRLNATLKEALESGLGLLNPIPADRATTVSEVLLRAEADGRPILVTEGEQLLGIATPYDLL
jgi:hypothetical protein